MYDTKSDKLNAINVVSFGLFIIEKLARTVQEITSYQNWKKGGHIEWKRNGGGCENSFYHHNRQHKYTIC